ncbi:MAG: hypothetical protein ACI814_001452 [Mariniblastus sp.]|jgi:hypothetical protein
MKFLTLLLTVFSLAAFATVEADDTQPVLVESYRIWDEAPHNAFTDLIRFEGKWFCVFREAQRHVSANGALRIITSKDGSKWESAALISSPDSDLRDAKISITPDNQLMLAGAEAIPHPQTKKSYKHQSLVWFSDDGKTWSAKQKVAEADYWLWRITWHKTKAYGFGYATGKNERSVRLYKSDDGKQFKTLVANAAPETGYVNETSMVFNPDGTCYCLLRRDGTPSSGLLGTALPPFTKWDWKDLGVKLGGPDMIRLPDGRFIAAVRLYDGGARTSLCWIDVEKGTLTEALKLPSGGDCSYAGMVWHEDMLWVSYYSSHEKKTSIYLAKVRLENK